MQNAVVVLTTVGSGFDASALARALVEERVAACVNVLPRVTSVYRWEGRISEDAEQLLVIKTGAAAVNALREALFRRHPYDVPEFVVLPVESMSDAYGAWLLGEVTPP